MSAEKDSSTHSDPENSGSEKPVREKLQKASIDASSQKLAQDCATDEAKSETATTGTNGTKAAEPVAPGRLEKKRSHEIMEGEEEVNSEADENAEDGSLRHTRKRSRDNSTETAQEPRKALAKDPEENSTLPATDEKPAGLKRPSTPEGKAVDAADESALEALASPKTKKTRHNASEEVTGAAKTESSTKDDAPASSIPATNGFANTSATSPFGGLAGAAPAGTESTKPAASAFESSGFKTLSEKPNGFGALAGPPLSGFGSGGSFASGQKQALNGSSAKEDEAKAAGSTFGGALGQRSAFAAPSGSTGSAFGSGTSGFSKLGSATGGFGSTTGGFGSGFGGSGFGSLGGGGGLTSFASGKATAPLGASSTKAAKAFGAPANDDDDDNDNDNEEDDNDEASGVKSPLSTDVEKQDERFYEQELETGEENEVTAYSCRAKLYNFGSNPAGKKEWRERGFGTLRLNVKKMDLKDTDAAPQARLVMRAEGSHRVVLNTPVQKELKFGDPKGGPPQGAYMFLMGVVLGEGSTGGGLELLQLKMRASYTMELYEAIVKLQNAM